MQGDEWFTTKDHFLSPKTHSQELVPCGLFLVTGDNDNNTELPLSHIQDTIRS